VVSNAVALLYYLKVGWKCVVVLQRVGGLVVKPPTDFKLPCEELATFTEKKVAKGSWLQMLEATALNPRTSEVDFPHIRVCKIRVQRV
jgi:hypothetical protein